jgi:predicted porin
MLMKKSIIALAVAGALTAPIAAQADATLYGSLRIKATSFDGASELNVTDNSSRIGIKGSSDLFSGAKAIFQFEQAVSTDTGAFSGGRLGYLGATGDFGTATFGRQWTPHYNWTGAATDILDNRTSGATAYTNGTHRVSDTMAYITPDLNGFRAAAVIIASDNADGEDLDAYNLAATFAANGFTFGASILGNEVTNNDITALSAAYSAGAFYVAAKVQNDETKAEEESYELAASYSMGNTKLLANYIDDDNGISGSGAGEQFLLKFSRSWAKKLAYLQHTLT